MHHALPHVALGSAAALEELDWSDARLSAAAGAATLRSPALYGASLDLSDSLYQFKHEPLGEDFGIDFPELAAEHGAT